MKQLLAGLGILSGLLLVLFGLSLAFGWFQVGYTRTVGKAQQNADREVFEQSQSYVEGKRQEVAKAMHEYTVSKDQEEKEAIRTMLRQSLSNFDLNKLQPEQRSFVDTAVIGR